MILRLLTMSLSISIMFSGDIDDVLETYEAFDKAFVDEKPQDMFSHMHENHTVFWNDNGWLDDYGTVKGWTADYLPDDYTWSVRDRDVKENRNPAVVATIATATSTSDGSETKIYQVRETGVLSKVNDKWFVVHMHSSDFKPKNDD